MNLYFFRNMITGKVIISKEFQLQSSLLNQIGEHRPSLKIRQDHWVPFTVLTGLPPDGALADHIQSKLTTIRTIGPLPRYRLPLPPNYDAQTKAKLQDAKKGLNNKIQEKDKDKKRRSFGYTPLDPAELFVGWRVPDMVKEKTVGLCKVLNGEELGLGIKTALENFARGGAGSDSSSTSQSVSEPSQPNSQSVPSESFTGLTLWWERDEYQFLVNQAQRELIQKHGIDMSSMDVWSPEMEKTWIERKPELGEALKNLRWPTFVTHRRLFLARNRYPAVPGLEMVGKSWRG
ncbi:hypothetical protein HDU97_010168 [Phlyctochytrium planicorne]|nr:hypothetical protein HDU97_010168 [Phlyctochytrium planicorne]